MADDGIDIPNTTITQRILAIGGLTLSVGGDSIQALGSIIENSSENAASYLNQNFVNNPSASALVRSSFETAENTVLAVGKFGKAFTSLSSSATSWGSSLLYYSAGTLRNYQLEDAGFQPVYDTDILAEIDFGSISASFSEPSIENETSLSASRRQILKELDGAVSELREVILDSSLDLQNPAKLDTALAVLVEARRLADGTSDLSIVAGYIGENMEAIQSATNELSDSFQSEIARASQQFDELNPYIGNGAEEFVELLERMSNSGLEAVDGASDVVAVIASLISGGGTLTEEMLEVFIEENLPLSELMRLPLNAGQKQILVDVIYKDTKCFGSGTPIDMWPLDLSLKPGPDGAYDQDAVRAQIWQKPIEQVKVGDLVVSFDDTGNLVPGYVPRTMTNTVKILLNLFGTRVTPGHVYFRADSKKSYKYETLIDILRDDGVIKHQDGTLIRAATNIPVGDPRDGFVQAVTGPRTADGSIAPKDRGRIRLGTRFLVEGNRSYAVADLIKAGGGVVGEDELIRVGDSAPMPFHWEFGDTLPGPEDFVLACSGTTLEDIYKAAEWESQGPQMPAPMVMDGGPVQPLSQSAISAMPRNEPLTLAPVPTPGSQQGLNRKQRKAMEARQRKAAKTRNRVMS